MNRDLARAARRFADSTSDRIADQPTGQFFATVVSVTPNAASDGNAVVTIEWRGAVVTAAGYAASYTPVKGHRVVCTYIDNQPVIAHRVIGQP